MGLKECTTFYLHESGINIEWNQTKPVREDFVDDDRSVVPYIHIFDGNSWDLLKLKISNAGRRMKGFTSAIRILRKAFAMDASTPTRSNSIERCDRRWTFN
jgi:hypothetical protein